jgi:2-haloacid dehalogenase
MSTNIKALIFDIGGVLFFPKENGREKHLLSSFKEASLLANNYGIDALENFGDLFAVYQKSAVGEISKEETADSMSKILGISAKETEELFRKIYTENTIENHELYEYVLRLKKDGYKIGILSIQFHLSKDVMVPKKYYDNFDALDISSDDKLKKPDKKAYESILEKLKIKPEESIFVDDNQRNLDVAEELNMKTILFKDNKHFFEDVEKFNIKR